LSGALRHYVATRQIGFVRSSDCRRRPVCADGDANRTAASAKGEDSGEQRGSNDGAKGEFLHKPRDDQLGIGSTHNAIPAHQGLTPNARLQRTAT